MSVSIAFLFLFILSSMSVNAAGDTCVTSIAQYQRIISEVNEEYGACFTVPSESESTVLQNLMEKGYTEETFKNQLIRDWHTFLAIESGSNISTATDNIIKENGITPFSVRETVTQRQAIEYNSTVFLNAVVFSGSGVAGTYTYESIKSKGVETNPKVMHLSVSSISQSLSSNRKICTVTVVAYPVSADGVMLTVKKTYKVPFYAG